MRIMGVYEEIGCEMKSHENRCNEKKIVKEIKKRRLSGLDMSGE